MKKYFLVLCFLLLSSSSCMSVECKTENGCLRVLFIGNSYTSFNDLPNTFAKIAASGKHQVEVGIFAPNGWTLTDHTNSSEEINVLKSSAWNYVIVQEQSQIPAMTAYREQVMYPAARTLIGRIRETGATPIFFETWAHRDGMPENNGLNFEGMQYEIDQGYLGIGRELNVPVAPVGDAWFGALMQNPQLNLWQDDGSHPTEQGTFLAACVFYAFLYNESPKGLPYKGNIPEDIALQLQEIAANRVLLP